MILLSHLAAEKLQNFFGVFLQFQIGVDTFLDLRQSYDYLKATFDILRDENTSMLQQIKAIEAAYEEACCTDWWHIKKEAVERFDRLLEALPDRVWIE